MHAIFDSFSFSSFDTPPISLFADLPRQFLFFAIQPEFRFR